MQRKMNMTLTRLEVHSNGHALMDERGEPFFWLGDTAWCLFQRLTQAEAEHYLSTRAQQGFNVIQIVALSEADGLRVPNPNGDVPFHDLDPAKPNERFFEYVDWVIRRAGELGMYVALLPMWGDKLMPDWGIGPAVFFDKPEVMRSYGEWLGMRYRDDSNVIWMLGGDRPAVVTEDFPYKSAETPNYDYRPLWGALTEGIEAGVGAHPLMTYHIMGGPVRTSQQIHNEAWLDVNSMQSGHGGGHDVPVWEAVEADYALTPPKPTIDLEPNYEDHPVSPWPKWDPASGYFRESDVRRQVYRSVFAGACGVTYGHHSVWQFCAPRYTPVNYATMYWQEAILRPGASQMIHLRRLMESRPFFERAPKQELIAGGQGEGRTHLRATGDDGSYGFVFFPDAVRTAAIDLRLISGNVRAWWYDTHTGEAYPAGEYESTGTVEFTTPLAWHDWVLVLDEAAQGYGAPGE
jgi:hypothetical protein